MFISELEQIVELMKIYKESRVKYDLFLDSWLEGCYETLVPRILFRMRAMRRFVYCLQDALGNDRKPHQIRLLGFEAAQEISGNYPELLDEYHPVFSGENSEIILHLIEEVNIFGVNRYNLRDGIWEESDYWNLKSLGSLMGTICFICTMEFLGYDIYWEKSKVQWKEDDEVECAWMYGDDLYDDITPELDLPTYIKPSEIENLVNERII